MKTSDIESPTNLACLKIAPKSEEIYSSVTSEKTNIHIQLENLDRSQLPHLLGFIVQLRTPSSSLHS